MNKEEILKKIVALRKKAYKLDGSYEDSYVLLMNGLDKIIGEGK